MCHDLLHDGDGHLDRVTLKDKSGGCQVVLPAEAVPEFEDALKLLGVDRRRVATLSARESAQPGADAVLTFRLERDEFALWFVCEAVHSDRERRGMNLGGWQESYWVSKDNRRFFYCYSEVS